MGGGGGRLPTIFQREMTTGVYYWLLYERASTWFHLNSTEYLKQYLFKNCLHT